MDYLSSPVWSNVSRAITQPWGVTSLLVEPYWKQAQAHWHCGIDIGVSAGTPLYAARPGKCTVAMLGLVKVNVNLDDHSEDDCYVHIESTNVRVGDNVTAGQLVAHSGNVNLSGGYTTGAHLHFEVQVGALNTPATSLDPVPVLTQRFGPISQGGFMAALSDQEQADLASNVKAIYAILAGSRLGVPAVDAELVADTASLKQILDAVNAVKVPAVDGTALANAIALALAPKFDEVTAAIQSLKTELDAVSVEQSAANTLDKIKTLL